MYCVFSLINSCTTAKVAYVDSSDEHSDIEMTKANAKNKKKSSFSGKTTAVDSDYSEDSNAEADENSDDSSLVSDDSDADSGSEESVGNHHIIRRKPRVAVQRHRDTSSLSDSDAPFVVRNPSITNRGGGGTFTPEQVLFITHILHSFVPVCTYIYCCI